MLAWSDLRNSLVSSLLLSAIASAAFAGQILYVDADAPGPEDGSSWSRAYRYLQDALAAASSGDTIRVAEGTYRPDRGGGQTPGDRHATFQLVSGVTLQGGYAGFGEPDPDARSISGHESTLSGSLGGANSYHVVTGSGTSGTTVLDGFTVQSANADGLAPDDTGGGMLNEYGSPTVINCTFSGNYAGFGGGMFNRGSSPTVIDCTFSGNSSEWYGGGMHNFMGSSPTVTNCTFSGNTSIQYGAGGMENDTNSNAIVTHCSFSGNSVNTGGGGISNYESSPTISYCSFSGNSALDGGGIDNAPGSSVSVSYCSFRGNSVSAYGGGMQNKGSATVRNCTFSSNSAYAGGGFHNNDCSTDLINCTFAGNSATNGNAVACDSFKQSRPSYVEITNCILWDGGGEIENLDGSTITVTYSDVQGGLTGQGNIYADPAFSDSDYHLAPHSPCIDAGDPASSYSEEPEPDGDRINMGRWGNTSEATSKGEVETVDVPDVVGMSQAAAATAIVGVGLSVGSQTQQYSDTVPEGHVISQDPAGGTAVPLGSSVALVISSGPEPDTVTITISSSGGGTVTVPGEGSFQYERGVVLSVEATAHVGYHFVNWTGTAVDAGKVADPSATDTTVTLDNDYTLRANFAADPVEQYTISVSAGPNGSVSPSGTIVKSYGQSQTFGASPETAYSVDSWYLDGTAVQFGGTFYTLHDIRSDHTVHVTFEPVQHTITASAGPGGYVSPTGTITKGHHENQQFVATPETGYRVKRWYLNGSVAQDGGNVYTLNDIDSDHVVLVSFMPAISVIYVNDNAPDDPGPSDPGVSDPNEDGSLAHPLDAIQEAIAVAENGDTVVVLPGTYYENIDFLGKNITVTSLGANYPSALTSTIIEGSQIGAVVTFNSGEGPACTLNGFTVTGGRALNGGAVCIDNSSEATIANCIVAGNIAVDGGGVYCRNSGATVTNCTIGGNQAAKGGGLYLLNANVVVANCIVWDNAKGQIHVGSGSQPVVRFSNVQGGASGTGNLDTDPGFAGPGFWEDSGTPNNPDDDFWIPGDYHLVSEAGRWDPNIQLWVQDEVSSPCIDTGDVSNPIGFEPFPSGGVVNMGAYGGTADASKAYFGEPVCTTVLQGDANGDCRVDWIDFAFMAFNWLRE
ncbi:MAG: PASTA domain-containing protein, partial [Phycisphaerales bacterium]